MATGEYYPEGMISISDALLLWERPSKENKMSYQDDWNKMGDWNQTPKPSTPTPVAKGLEGYIQKYLKPGFQERTVLHEILRMTNYDTPGVYEPDMIEKVNALARKILDMPVVSDFAWPHNKTQEPNVSEEISPNYKNAYILNGILIKEALEKLSGDLSHDNVAAAKQILKGLIGRETPCRYCKGLGVMIVIKDGTDGSKEKCPYCKGSAEISGS